MKILHIMARLNIGGTTPYVIQLIAAQREQGHDSRLICGQVGPEEGDMRYVADQYSIQVTILPSLGREISVRRDLQTLLALWQIIRRERPDVVHTHTAKAGFVGRVAAWLAGVPMIVHTFHGHVFSGYFSPAKTQVYLWLERLCARLSQRIIALSAVQKQELSERYRVAPAAKFAIVPLGFDLAQFAADAPDDGTFRAQSGIPHDAPLIGIVGRLVPVKNHALFLRAAALVVQQRPNAHFVIVGDGEEREALTARVAALGLTARVHFAGWVTDLAPVYRALAVAVCSSLNEGLPVNLIEAMAAGVPVVATPVGGVPDLLAVGRLGAMVPLNDEAAMAAAILDALGTGKWSARVQAARATALGEYGIARSAARVAEVYASRG
jgi:glycosyltransferase involved in cell wall biosynthesis